MAHLCSRDWPGNIRELENTIQGWSAMIPGEMITRRDIGITERPSSEPPSLSADFSRPYKELKEEVLEKFSLQYLTTLLGETGGNVTVAAQKSGIQRQSLQKIIKRYGIDPESFRSRK